MRLKNTIGPFITATLAAIVLLMAQVFHIPDYSKAEKDRVQTENTDTDDQADESQVVIQELLVTTVTPVSIHPDLPVIAEYFFPEENRQFEVREEEFPPVLAFRELLFRQIISPNAP